MNFSAKISLLRDFLSLRLKRSSRPGGRSGTLTVRLDRIGDFALFAPFAAAAFRPGERCYMAANSLWAESCAKLFPEITVIPVAPGRFLEDSAYRRRLLETFAGLRAERLLHPRFYRELLVEELIGGAAGAEECLRFRATRRHLQPFLLKHLAFPAAAEIGGAPDEHELTRNARFAEICSPGFEVSNPWLSKPFAAPEFLRGRDYFCLCPGSGKGASCCWPAERWGKVLRELDLPHCVIVGTPAEEETVRRTAAMLPPEKVTAALHLSVEQFMGTVSHARGVLGNDTGGIHLAAMSGVPSIAVAGRGQPGWFLPYPEHIPVPGVIPPITVSAPCDCENCFWRCGHLSGGICRCIDDISADQVLEAAGKSSFSALR